MWGAMLGGAIGASVGLFGGSWLVSSSLGFVAGFMCSVITVSGLLALSYIVSSMIGTEFEDMPIGCPTSSQLSGFLGGFAGAIGAVILAHFGASRLQARSGAFALCWSITAFLPVIMALIVVRLARYRAAHPELPAWMRPIEERITRWYERYNPNRRY